MKIQEVVLVNFGKLTTDVEEQEFNSNSPTGYFLHPSKVEFIERMSTLKGHLGLKFGIEYMLKGVEPDRNYPVTFCSKILHPELINPETNERFSKTIEAKSDYLNETNFDYLFFEFEWEVKKGIYIFQIIESERVLLEKSFEIV